MKKTLECPEGLLIACSESYSDCNTKDAGFKWKLHHGLYANGSVKDLFTRDPLGSRLIQRLNPYYQGEIRTWGWDEKRVRERFFPTTNIKKWRYHGDYMDVVCGVKTGRITTLIAQDTWVGGASMISPTEEFYDICVVPVVKRFGVNDFNNPEIVRRAEIRNG